MTRVGSQRHRKKEVIYLFVDLTSEIVWCCLHLYCVVLLALMTTNRKRDVNGNGFGLNYSNVTALAAGTMESYRIDSSRIVGLRTLTYLLHGAESFLRS